jgi:uncharacterized protein (TIGR03435 family)
MDTQPLRYALSAFTALLMVATICAAPQSNQPAFEVASVKANKSGAPGGSFGGRPGGQLVVTNNTVRNIVRNSYGLQDFQIVGGPDWMSTDRFDIIAKAASDAPPSEMLLMAQRLLADRFGLVAHRETREIDIYALVMARADRRPGAELRPAAVDCAALVAASRRPGGPPLPRTAPGDRPVCGMQTAPGRMMAGGYALPDVARNLSNFAGRMVVDRTGLTGTFDLSVTWTPDQMPAGGLPPGAPAIDPNGPSLFTALQEQLGLKLEGTRGPVEVLVIDRVERPTED